jgi:PAS domain S-box-containing protein
MDKPYALAGPNQHKYFFDLLMQAPGMIAILKGPDHVFETANAAFQKLIGKSNEILGQRVIEVLPEVEDQGFITLLDQVYQTGKPYISSETRLLLSRNSDRPEELFLNFIYQPITDEAGEVIGILAQIINITEQVSARNKARESEDKYRTLFNSIDQGFCILEMLFDDEHVPVDYRFIETNPVFESQTGLKGAQGRTARELVPTLEDRWFKIYGKVAVTGNPERFIESSEAMNRWFEVYAFRIGGSSSRKVALLFSDITQRITSEKELKSLMDELERRVRDRTDQLRQVNQALQNSNEDLLQFAHVASHDLKEPIRKIQLFADMLRSDHDSVLSDRANLYLNKIERASGRMVQMIDGILTYSRADSYKQPVQRIDLTAILRNVEADLEVIIQQKRARLEYTELPVIEGAPVLISQLFYNLINNSLKFSKADTAPLITIKAEPANNNDEAFVNITVTDNGLGFDPVFSDTIFTPFARLHTKDQIDGTGLGLSLCKKIVTRHHGRIRAKAKINDGAVFTIELPEKQPYQFI